MEIQKKEYSIFYNNGIRKSKGEYTENIKNGFYKEYYISGNTECEGFYKNDKQDGEWVFYSEAGEIIKIVLYNEGKILKEEVYPQQITILK